MKITDQRPRRQTGEGVPLSAEGLTLKVERVATGRVAPAITLRVYAAGKATNVGMTLPARHARHFAELVIAAATRACEEAMFAPTEPDPGHAG